MTAPTSRSAAAWCRDGADWSDGTHATWHAVDPATGRMVGNVSLFAIDTDDLVAKIGYRVLPSGRGRVSRGRWWTPSPAGRSSHAG